METVVCVRCGDAIRLTINDIGWATLDNAVQLMADHANCRADAEPAAETAG